MKKKMKNAQPKINNIVVSCHAAHGITLVALIITIIILIILAGVTLNITLGENGIFQKSKEAVDIYKDAAQKEQEQLDDVYLELTATKIYTQEDLEKISENPSGAYQLENDITLDDTWTPIETFSGILNGNGHTISDVNVKSRNGGIIKELNENGEIKNLRIKGTMQSNGSGMGGIVYTNNGIITNCTTEINANGEMVSVGCIVTYNNGIIRKCISKGEIIGMDECQGIAQYNEGQIEECYNITNITTSSFAGGISYDNEGIIINCFNIGNIQGSYSSGGIISCDNYGIIKNCYNTGILIGRSKHGIAQGSGSLEGGAKIENCYSISEEIASVIEDQNAIINCRVIEEEESRMKETYQGFDFDTVWQIEEGETTPYLRGMEKPENVKI